MHARPTHLTVTPRQDRQGWLRWGIVWSVAIAVVLGLILLSPSTVQARTFQCRAGDVACLIASIKQANIQPGDVHEIRLASGVYTLTAVDNMTDGSNGLPSITGHLTITGAGADLTIIERNVHASFFRLVHVGATGDLTLDGLMLTGGVGFGGDGGGLFNQGGTVSIADTIFTGNHGNLTGGGGLANNGGRVNVAQTSFTSNIGKPGGGLLNRGGTVTITQTTFAGNVADGGGGLIIYGGTVTITDSTIADNDSESEGGGLINDGGMLTITNSTVAHNSGLDGGGLVSVGGTTRILNSTFAENDGGYSGGGIAGTVTLQNTILARNTGEIGPDCLGTLTSLGNNLIGDPTGCTITLLPTDLTGAPGLGDFTDNGTPGNGHFPLPPTSPAIDAGNDAVCPKRDQLGEKRVGPCDIGAIEFQGAAVSSR